MKRILEKGRGYEGGLLYGTAMGRWRGGLGARGAFCVGYTSGGRRGCAYIVVVYAVNPAQGECSLRDSRPKLRRFFSGKLYVFSIPFIASSNPVNIFNSQLVEDSVDGHRP